MKQAIGLSVVRRRPAFSINRRAPIAMRWLKEYDVFSAIVKHPDCVKRELCQLWARWEATVLASEHRASFAEHGARTGYSLLQASTFALKDRAKSSPQGFAATAIGLQQLLNPPRDVIDVDSTPVIAG